MEDAPASRPHGKPRCGAHARSTGKPCKRGAGAGTSHPGVGLCSNHGGASPGGELHAERSMAVQEAQRFGLDMTDITAGEALMREVRRASAMVDWLAARVNQIGEDDLTWGLAWRRITPPEKQGGQPSQVVEQRTRIHPFVTMLDRERSQLRGFAESAHRCGIEERLTRAKELEGEMMAKLIRAVLSDPDLGLTRQQWTAVGTVVPRHLRALDGAA